MRNSNKNILSILFLSLCTILFIQCNTATPEKYFNVVVLNVNLLFGFATDVMARQLESPSVELNDDGGTQQMTRVEGVDAKIKSIKENFEKVEELKQTEDTKDMLNASIELYKYVLPVYETEYVQLAKLYDNGASLQETQILTNTINQKYFPRFSELYDNLISKGKIYAEKNNIKVNWNVQTTPPKK